MLCDKLKFRCQSPDIFLSPILDQENNYLCMLSMLGDTYMSDLHEVVWHVNHLPVNNSFQNIFP
jgi:hypothetical protein